jgi:hypothetical protein
MDQKRGIVDKTCWTEPPSSAEKLVALSMGFVNNEGLA